MTNIQIKYDIKNGYLDIEGDGGTVDYGTYDENMTYQDIVLALADYLDVDLKAR